jgi:uncharacterized RDD family membrane protein YckC
MAKKRDIKALTEKIVPSPLWKRVFAYFLDVVIINFIVVMPFRPLLSSVPSAKTFSAFRQQLVSRAALSTDTVVVLLIIAALSILYWAVFEYKLGQSVGKMAFNIHVRSQKGNLTFMQALLRNLSKISTLVLLADALFIILTKGHQRYLERVSKTEVVERRWFV